MNEGHSIIGGIFPALARTAFARRAIAVGAVVAALWAAPARGEARRLKNEEACVSALSSAKALEQEGSLREAKDLLRSCAQRPCSTFVWQQCAVHFTKLESDMPTIVLLVTESSGTPRNDVRVRVDGTPFASHLDGRALPIDPGMHDFSFSANGKVFATQRVLIVQGQRNRFITALIGGAGGGAVDADGSHGPPVDYQPPAAAQARATRPTGAAKTGAKKTIVAESAPAAGGETDTETAAEPTVATAPASAGKHKLLPWIIGGVGVASLGAGALLTYWGRKDNDVLAQCAPDCNATGPSHIRRLYRDADIAIGVGVAALAAAYWAYAVTHSSSGESPASETALRFDVAPARSGGFAAVSGSF